MNPLLVCEITTRLCKDAFLILQNHNHASHCQTLQSELVVFKNIKESKYLYIGSTVVHVCRLNRYFSSAKCKVYDVYIHIHPHYSEELLCYSV